MSTSLKNLLQNIKDIYLSDSNLETLLDYERVLDEMDLYTFKNWRKGELIEGPIYEKYFVTCKWKYNYREMPDPAGGVRLLNYGCEIFYELDSFEYPIEVKSPDDFKPGTKVPKLVSRPVWIVSITIPKKLMSEIQKGSVELENETLDQEEIESAAEQGEDNDVFQNQNPQTMPPPQGLPK
jgi:hypothetical protein